MRKCTTSAPKKEYRKYLLYPLLNSTFATATTAKSYSSPKLGAFLDSRDEGHIDGIRLFELLNNVGYKVVFR